MSEMSSEKRKRGRPTKYRPEFPEQAYKLALLGATDRELADFFGICEDTIYAWKKDKPKFSEAINKGKLDADARVARRLFDRAMGYSQPEEKVFCHGGKIVKTEVVKHYPPDTTAGIFWLKNRQPDKWREKQQMEHSGTLLLDEVMEQLYGKTIEEEAVEITDAKQINDRENDDG